MRINLSTKVLWIIILMLLIVVSALSWKIYKDKPEPIANNEPTSEVKIIENQTKFLPIKNSHTMSYLEVIDLNNDEVDEVIFEKRSMSWDKTYYVLNEQLQPFCENCEFTVHNGFISHSDLNNDKILEILIINEADYSLEDVQINSEVIVYSWNGSNYVKNMDYKDLDISDMQE